MRLRHYIVATGAYMAAFIGLGLTTACLGPTLPRLAAVASVGLARIGLLIFTRSLGTMIGSLLAGPAIDRGHGRAVLTISVLAMAACMALVPFSRQLLPLAGIFLLIGIGQGALNTGANTLLIWTYPDRAHSLLSVLHFCYGVGSLVAPLLVAWSLPVRTDGLFVYWILAALVAPVGIWFIASAQQPSGHIEHTNRARPSSRRAFYWAVVLFFSFVGAETTIGSWLFVFGERAAQLSPATASYLVATFWGAFTAGRLLTIVGASFIRPTRFVFWSICACVVSSIGVLALPYDGIGLWISVAAVGLSMAALFPQAFAFVNTSLGMTGWRTAWLLIASGLGGMLLPLLAGLLLDTISANFLHVVVAAAMLLALVSFLMVRRTAPRQSEAISI